MTKTIFLIFSCGCILYMDDTIKSCNTKDCVGEEAKND